MASESSDSKDTADYGWNLNLYLNHTSEILKAGHYEFIPVQTTLTSCRLVKCPLHLLDRFLISFHGSKLKLLSKKSN